MRLCDLTAHVCAFDELPELTNTGWVFASWEESVERLETA